jgi:acetyl esterase
VPDYQSLIDAETWAFITETYRWYPEDTASKPVEEQRKRYDAMSPAFHSGNPAGIIADTTKVNGVPVRMYGKSGASAEVTVIYTHGGGLVVGGLDSHDDVCAEICDATGFDVIAVDYRLLPEFTVNDAIEDCFQVLDWVREFRPDDRIVLVGDSAGGYLAAVMSNENRHAEDIAGQVLIYPGFGYDLDGGSLDEHAFAPMLTRDDLLIYRDMNKSNQSAQSRAAWEYDGLPASVSISAQCDPLSDEAQQYASLVNKAGGQAIWGEDEGLVHGHLRARHTVRRARASFDRILRATSAFGNGTVLTREVLFGSDCSD